MGKQVILSHGMESGPDATKVTAMGKVARELGWSEVRPDFSDLDDISDPLNIDKRIQRLLDHVDAGAERVVFAGSSLGSFASALASLKFQCHGLFLLAPPIYLPSYSQRLDIAAVPCAIVHGWDDELIPAADVIKFAQQRKAQLILVNDAHRLSEHVQACAQWFGQFLKGLK